MRAEMHSRTALQWRRAGALVVLMGLAGCVCRLPPDETRDPAVGPARARAETAARNLATRLQAHLGEALEAGGTDAAIDVCATVAQDLTNEIGREEGVVIRRTALRVRNPRNRPDEFERRVLEEWTAAGRTPEPRAVVLPSNAAAAGSGAAELRFMKPIVLAEMCVQCHGPREAMAEAARAVLAEHYPHYEATGFRPGDLRGAISVRVPLAPGG